MKCFGNFISLGITGEAFSDHALLRKLTLEAAEKGYEGINVYFCSPSIAPEDPEAVAAVRLVCEVARKKGMKVAMDAMPEERTFLNRYPDAYACSLERIAIPVKAGKNIEVRLNYSTNNVSFAGIAGVFLLEGHRDKDCYQSYRSYPDLAEKWTKNFEIESVIGLDRAHKARSFATRNKQVVLQGKVPAEGLLVVYGLFRNHTFDLGSPSMREWIDMLMERYHDLPLDGLSWDEPGLHAGGHWPPRRFWSKSLQTQIKKQTGENILSRCLLLDYRVEGTDWSVVRQAFFQAMIHCVRNNQLYLKTRAMETFGPDVELGIHHTWSETDSNDIFIGNIDYFYLADALSSGYTDNTWFFGEEAMVYTNVLARSLARKTDKECAYCNSWDYSPREKELDRSTQILALNQVHFFHIGIGDRSVVSYPHHHVWNLMPRYLDRLNSIQRLLQDLRPATDVAAIHSWESLARINNDRIHAHRISLVYLAHQAITDSRAFDFVGTDMFAQAKVEADTIRFGKDTYRTVIVPWPLVLSPTVIQKLDRFIDGGGRVIFYGPPAVEDTAGESTKEHFARWLGGASAEEASIQSIDPAGHCLEWIEEDGTSETLAPHYDPERKMEIRARERMHVEDVQLPVYPVTPGAARVFLRWKKKPIGIASPDGRVQYLAFDFPYYEEIIPRLLGQVCHQRPLTVPKGVAYREFVSPDHNNQTKGYVFVARKGNRMRGSVKLGNKKLDLNGKGVVAVRLEGSRLTIQDK